MNEKNCLWAPTTEKSFQELDVKSDLFEFDINKTQVVRKIVTISHYFALSKLVQYYELKKGKYPDLQDLFGLYEPMLRDATCVNFDFSKLSEDVQKEVEIEKKKFEEVRDVLRPILRKKKDLIKEECKEAGLAVSGTKSLLASRLVKKNFKEKIQFRPNFWLWENFEKNLKEMKEEELQTLLHLAGVTVGAKDHELLCTTIKSLRQKDTLKPEEKNILTLYVFFKHFSTPCVLLHQAIRKGDFETFVLVLKMSLKIFEIAGKPQYWWLVSRHLFDMYYRFSEFHLQLYKKMFVIRCKTTKTHCGIDEKNEFVNKFLKEHLRSVSIEQLEFLSENYNVLEQLLAIWKKNVDFRTKEEKNKSSNISYDNVGVLQEVYENFVINLPLSLLKRYNEPLNRTTISEELRKIAKDLKLVVSFNEGS